MRSRGGTSIGKEKDSIKYAQLEQKCLGRSAQHISRRRWIIASEIETVNAMNEEQNDILTGESPVSCGEGPLPLPLRMGTQCLPFTPATTKVVCMTNFEIVRLQIYVDPPRSIYARYAPIQPMIEKMKQLLSWSFGHGMKSQSDKRLEQPEWGKPSS